MVDKQVDRVVIPAPLPVAVGAVEDGWSELRSEPEMACMAAWSQACRAWWQDEHDARLRDRALGALLCAPPELDAWLTLRLDPPGLIRAHGHVTAMRAGLEGDVGKRELSTGAFRTTLVGSDHRGGARTVFTAASDVMSLVGQLPGQLDALPDHPLVRAAWLTQALGAIHPFPDSNGGTSRFLASLQLARASLPPVILTPVERSGAYMDALMHANATNRLERLTRLFYNVVHRGLAEALLGGTGNSAEWDPSSLAHAERWISLVDRTWRVAVGPPLASQVLHESARLPEALGRFARRGLRLPAAPAPRCVQWSLSAPLPMQLDLAIAPVRAGASTWSIAVINASVGSGSLGAAIHPEASELYFVAPTGEPIATVDARFQRWLDRRIEQCVKGLAPWM